MATTPPIAHTCPARPTSPSRSPAAGTCAPKARRARRTDMSLLLEALKKAEKAKEEAQRRARSESEGPAAAAAAQAAQPAPVLELDMRPALRLAGDESKRAEPALALAEAPAAPRESAPPPPPPRPQASTTDTQAAERTAARKVFEEIGRAH